MENTSSMKNTPGQAPPVTSAGSPVHPLAVAAYHNKVGAHLLCMGDQTMALKYFQSAMRYMSSATGNSTASPSLQGTAAASSSVSPSSTSTASCSSARETSPTANTTDVAPKMPASSPRSRRPTFWTSRGGAAEPPIRLNNNNNNSDHPANNNDPSVVYYGETEDQKPVVIYSRALTFKGQDIATLEDFTYCWAIVEFNMAVAWHRLYMTHKGGDQCLRRALALYDSSLSHASSSTQTNAVRFNLILVALNNKAQIYVEFCDLQMAQRVADVLLSVIEMAKRLSPSGLLMFSAEEVSRFRFHASVMKAMTLAAAA